MRSSSLAAEIISSQGLQEYLQTIVECLEKIQPHACAVVMMKDDSQSKPTILSNPSDESIGQSFDTYAASTYAIDPFAEYLPTSAKSEIHHAKDLPKPTHRMLLEWFDSGYPIELDRGEIFGYRTRNWLRHMDEVNLGFRLFGGKILEIRLFRELDQGGFDTDAIARLSYVMPVLSSALEMHSIYQGHFDSNAAQQANHVAPTQRQLEVFRWWAAGKTLEDIGIILGIKRRTVRYHMEKARELYGYSTVQQTAIRIAQDYKLDPLTGSLAGNEFEKIDPSALKM